MNLARELQGLLRKEGNTHCADCGLLLNEQARVYGSLVFGCFLCGNCADVHGSLQVVRLLS